MGQAASVLWIVFLFVIFYMLIIRPQQVKLRQRHELVASLRVGDRVETIGGIQGMVMSLDTDTIELQIAPEIMITLGRKAVAGRVGEEE